MRKRTYARRFGGNFQLSIFGGEKATVFLVLVLPVPFLETTSAMAKSADDIARLLNVFDLDNSTLADIIGDFFEDCRSRDTEEVGCISENFLETRDVVNSVITSMVLYTITSL